METRERETMFKTGDGWVSAELPEDAGTIQETRTGYSVALDGQHIGEREDRDDAEKLLAVSMNDAGFWPDCFYVNERGNVDQLIPDFTMEKNV